MKLFSEILAECEKMISDGRTPGMIFVSPEMIQKIADSLPDLYPPYVVRDIPIGVGVELKGAAFRIEEETHRDRLTIEPWEDYAVLAVLQDLDVADLVEVGLTRGAGAGVLDLWAALRVLGTGLRVARWDGEPFAVVGLANAGARGVGTAALLARNHRAWRPAIIALVRHLARRIGPVAGEQDLWRIECRSWAGHPGAERLLRAIGFREEARMPGFAAGEEIFVQWAWLRPIPSKSPTPET